jgi:type IV pilus assembly protein PilZ
MFIETLAPSSYGAEVVVHLTLPGLLLGTDVKSIVRWTEKGIGMGVQFGTMGARETHALVELLHNM